MIIKPKIEHQVLKTMYAKEIGKLYEAIKTATGKDKGNLYFKVAAIELTCCSKFPDNELLLCAIFNFNKAIKLDKNNINAYRGKVNAIFFLERCFDRLIFARDTIFTIGYNYSDRQENIKQIRECNDKLISLTRK